MVAQILAVTIFVAMFVLIVIDKIERQYITLGCGVITLVVVFGLCMHSVTAITDTLNIHSIFTGTFWYTGGAAEESSSGINWATIIFVAGMMVMVEGMARVGFFRWLCMRIAKLVHYKTMAIFMTFMIMSAVLSMFIDSITVILFLAAVTVELSQLLKFNPVPMILSEIFCANLGGSATMCGDPPNIIIGTSLGFAISCIIFATAVVLLITHAMTGLTVAFIGLFIALVTIITAPKHIHEIVSKVDYKTLLFFIGLFVVVGGLEQTGILEIAANFIGKISGGNAMLMVAIIIWLSAFASAFVDNIPFAATMIPIIKALAATEGVSLSTLAWALSMGTDIGGSATPIGASANVVGTSVAAKAGHPIGWGLYCKKVVPATILVLVISTVGIFVRYF